jgi:hypothetical protein
MYRQWLITILAALAAWPMLGHAENLAKEVKKAVERSTLDQPGTKAFHLRATVAPSFERDKESGRAGEVEIWWASPTQWKREVRAPEFHQIEIVDGARDWQKNEGDYFPEWLRLAAVEIIRPVPPLDQVLEQAKAAEVRRIGPMTNLNWTTPSGTPEVTAKVTTLEDLGEIPAGFFDTAAMGGDPPLRTVLMDEISLRKNLLPMEPVSWPPLQDGPLEGNVTTQVIVDREGKVRGTGTLVSENSGVNDAGRRAVLALRFKPFLVDGIPVQVISQLTVPFKTVRPSGTETFESAQTYFEHGRHLGFPAFANGTAYVLRAEFEVKGRDGAVAKGQYEDTWLSDSQWRREVWFGKSRYVRSRNGNKAYQSADGEDAGLLRLVMKIMEPIPAIDTFVESDWRIRRDTVNGVRTVRVLAGYESPEGKLDPEQARGYWFDDTGLLVKTYFNGIETQRLEFEDFAGVKTARHIDVSKDGKLAIRIHVTDVTPAGTIPGKTFEVKGHEWTRAFTAEVR